MRTLRINTIAAKASLRRSPPPSALEGKEKRNEPRRKVSRLPRAGQSSGPAAAAVNYCSAAFCCLPWLRRLWLGDRVMTAGPSKLSVQKAAPCLVAE